MLVEQPWLSWFRFRNVNLLSSTSCRQSPGLIRQSNHTPALRTEVTASDELIGVCGVSAMAAYSGVDSAQRTPSRYFKYRECSIAVGARVHLLVRIGSDHGEVWVSMKNQNVNSDVVARNFLFQPIGSLPTEGPGSEGVRSAGRELGERKRKLQRG